MRSTSSATSLHVAISEGITVANDLPFVLFGGINVIEDLDTTLAAAEHFAEVTASWGYPSFSRRRSTRPIARRSILSEVSAWRRAAGPRCGQVAVRMPSLDRRA